MRCRDDLSAKEWDVLLAEMGGHPLQSALWGQAKKIVYGISDKRLAIYIQDQLAALIRVENKGLKSFLKIGWIPQGPICADNFKWRDIEKTLHDKLKKSGIMLCITSPWKSIFDTVETGMRQTVWIDLSLGNETLWATLDKQWRYGVRNAQRLGAQVSISNTVQELTDFYQLCIQISQKKDFNFQYTQAFLQCLMDLSDRNSVETKLFLAKIGSKVAAGAFIIRVGKNIHYMWGAVDRQYSKHRLGEFIQWSVIEWACEKNCTLYDLEGIDEVSNPGVAAFKKKMGGEIINLQNAQMNHFNLRGKILSRVFRKKLSAV